MGLFDIPDARLASLEARVLALEGGTVEPPPPDPPPVDPPVIPPDVVNVKDYASIQAALNAANGRTVLIPAGAYGEVGIVPPNGATIMGDGAVFTGRGSSWVFNLQGKTGVSLKGLTFRSADYAAGAYCIWCAAAKDLSFENLRFEDVFFGIKTGNYNGQASGITIKNMTAVHCLRPLYLSDCTDVHVSDSAIDAVPYSETTSNQTHGLYMERNATYCYFDRVTWTRGSGYGLHLYAESSGNTGTHHVYFRDCTVDARAGKRSVYIDNEYSDIYFERCKFPGQVENDSSAAIFRMANPTKIHISGVEAHGYRLIYGGAGEVSGTFYGTTHGCDTAKWDVSGLTVVKP